MTELIDTGFVNIKEEMEKIVQSEILNSGVPQIYLANRLKTLEAKNEEQEKLLKALKALEDEKLWSVLVFGSVGNGKTTIVTAFVNEWIRKHIGDGTQTHYETLRDLTDKIRGGFDGNGLSDYKDELKYSELLVIDELTANPKVWTDYMKATVQNILVYRHANKKKTILIGNLTGTEIREMFEAQVLSRLREGYAVGMRANDMRQKGEL